MQFKKIRYEELNSKQQENYNYQKISSLLADYGFVTLRLTDDWQGADFIAQHIDGKTFIKVQLKGRLSFYKKYQGKDLYIAFKEKQLWYLVPHDEALEKVLNATSIGKTKSWTDKNGYSFPYLTKVLQEIMNLYKLE